MKTNKRSNTSFKLFIEANDGDRSVGLEATGVEIETHFPFMDIESRAIYRSQFMEALRNISGTSIKIALFEDECPDCHREGNFNKKKNRYICRNKKCLTNAPDSLD